MLRADGMSAGAAGEESRFRLDALWEDSASGEGSLRKLVSKKNETKRIKILTGRVGVDYDPPLV